MSNSNVESIGLVYYIMTDRFGLPSASYAERFNPQLANPIGFHGGSYASILNAIVRGYFQDLGVTTLIISTPQLLKKAVDFEFGHYHYPYYGYHVVDLFKAESRFGDYQDLVALIDIAHQFELKIVLDMCHHMHTEGALTQQKPEYFSETVGFSDLLKFNLGNPEAVRLLHNSFEYWLRQTGADGARWDSMHHLLDNGHMEEMSPEEMCESMSYLQDFFENTANPDKFWSVGEVLTGDIQKWSTFLSTDCPALYNYPLYYKLTRALACTFGRHTDASGFVWGNLNTLAAGISEMQARGIGSRCMNFVDNHDMPRFLTLVYRANGDNAPSLAAQRMNLALAVLFAIPGIPHLLFGTEKGFSGDGWLSPTGDGRPTLVPSTPSPFGTIIAALAKARQNHAALRQGNYVELWRPNAGQQIWAFLRVCEGAEPIAVVVNNTDHAVDLGRLEGGVSTQGLLRSGSLRSVLDPSQTGLGVLNDKLTGIIPAGEAYIVH